MTIEQVIREEDKINRIDFTGIEGYNRGYLNGLKMDALSQLVAIRRELKEAGSNNMKFLEDLYIIYKTGLLEGIKICRGSVKSVLEQSSN